MFGKKDVDNSSVNPKSMNQLGQGTTINGFMDSESDIRVDGKIKGNVNTKSKLVLGATGVIEGDVICQNGYIEGRINGKVEATELLILAKTALITGDIIIKKLVVEEGAKFNGKCTMGISVSRNNENEDSSSVRITKAI